METTEQVKDAVWTVRPAPLSDERDRYLVVVRDLGERVECIAQIGGHPVISRCTYSSWVINAARFWSRAEAEHASREVGVVVEGR